MLISGKSYRTIWVDAQQPEFLQIIDQTRLPHAFVIEKIATVEQLVRAIADMHVRGAPALGAAGAYGVWLSAKEALCVPNPLEKLTALVERLELVRPTAVNLRWGVRQVFDSMRELAPSEWIEYSLKKAEELAQEDLENCRKIGEHGLHLIQEICNSRKNGAINIMTHCNAGWLACVDYGTATAPIYAAKQAGLDLHVWVSETRPRNQGAQLTAWELAQQGIKHTLIVDSAAALLMQRGLVDLLIVGSDRTTRNGDVANKIGTYLKAIAAKRHAIPFYVALPSSTIDWSITDGTTQIQIEERAQDEIRSDNSSKLLNCPVETSAYNPAFDVTPAELVSALITERGICRASPEGILKLFPERKV